MKRLPICITKADFQTSTTKHRRSQGVHLHPKCGKKIRRNLQGKFVSAHPRQSKSQFLGHFVLGGEIWRVGVIHLVALACVLRVTTEKNKKVVNFFWVKKVHPERKSLLRLCNEIHHVRCWKRTPNKTAKCNVYVHHTRHGSTKMCSLRHKLFQLFDQIHKI